MDAKHCKIILLVTLAWIGLSGCVQQKRYADSDRLVVEKNASQARKAQTRIQLGLTYLKKGNTGQAKFNLDKALSFAPKLPDVHYSLGYYYQTVQNFDKAYESYLQAVKLDPYNGDALNNFGAFLCHQGRLSEAADFLLAAIEIKNYTRVWQSYENLGVCYQQSEKLTDKRQAIEYFKQALDYNDSAYTSLQGLVALLQDAEQWQDAKKYYDRWFVVSARSPEIYWIGYRISKQLNDNKAANGYGRVLLLEYPNSEQTQLYKKSLLQ